MYGEGISYISELLDLCVDANIVKRQGHGSAMKEKNWTGKRGCQSLHQGKSRIQINA